MFDINEELKKLPTCPGVYMHKDRLGTVIYVGKAVNLRNRVRQYFRNSSQHSPKVRSMVSNIAEFDYITCGTEMEALILECNLIKLHKPQYNILLKDDKHYPYLKIDLAQDYPRVELVRRVEKDGAKYFGPYIGATVVRDVLEVLHNSFPLRTCKHEFSFGHGMGGKHRPCIRYQMGLCLAPCTGDVMPGQYRQMLDEIIAFLNGKHEDVVENLHRRMMEASKNMEYEKAAMYRDRIVAMEQVLQKQKALAVSGGDQDVIAMASDGVDGVVEVIFLRGGKKIAKRTKLHPGHSPILHHHSISGRCFQRFTVYICGITYFHKFSVCFPAAGGFMAMFVNRETNGEREEGLKRKLTF